MSAIILQDEIVHYEVLGRGRPLLFLHGWIGSWRYWIPTMQAASISYRTYALDLWGFGDTAKNPSLYTLEEQIKLVDLFLQEMGIARAAMIGHGLGAVVALFYAARYQRCVDRVMAVGLPNGFKEIHPRLNTTPPTDLADWLLGRQPVTEAVRVEAPKADQKAIQYSLADLHALEMRTIPANLATPCLLVYGESDPVVGAPPPEYLFSLPEHIHQVIFEQSGHFPMLDESSKFNRLMVDFLSLTSGASPRQLQLKEEWKRRVR